MNGDDHDRARDRDRPPRPHYHDRCTSTAYACPPTMLESSEIYRALLSSPIYRELTLNTHIAHPPFPFFVPAPISYCAYLPTSLLLPYVGACALSCCESWPAAWARVRVGLVLLLLSLHFCFYCNVV